MERGHRLRTKWYVFLSLVDGVADFKFDNYSFLFTLENPYQIPPTQLVLNNKKYAILCNNKYGPVFGDNELYISDHFLSNAESFVHLGFTYCSETYKSFSLLINTDDNIRAQLC